MSADKEQCIKCHKSAPKAAYMRSLAHLAFKEGDAPLLPELSERHFVCVECADEFVKAGGKLEEFTHPLHHADFKVVSIVNESHTHDALESKLHHGGSQNPRHDKKVEEHSHSHHYDHHQHHKH